MNEINRQAYLSAFGIENYMPRWCLPMAPEPVVCVLPVAVSVQATVHSVPSIANSSPSITHTEPLISILPPAEKMGMATDMLASIVESKKNTSSSSAPINAATILQELGATKSTVVQPFTLSVWRPTPGFLIVDSRNTKLALPTELLLSNIVRAIVGAEKIVLNEEVLRWPMIENSFVSRTEDDARNELQTWLAVENELRPITKLWLLGDTASRYLLAATADHTEVLWQSALVANKELAHKETHALILPSLNELLKQPALKAKLWQVVV